MGKDNSKCVIIVMGKELYKKHKGMYSDANMHPTHTPPLHPNPTLTVTYIFLLLYLLYRVIDICLTVYWPGKSLQTAKISWSNIVLEL